MEGWKKSTHEKRKAQYEKSARDLDALTKQAEAKAAAEIAAQEKNAGNVAKPAADPVTPEEQGWFDKMYGGLKNDPTVDFKALSRGLEERNARQTEGRL